MNGHETYAKIAEIHPGQKAVIVSGYAETADVRKAQELGAGQYVKKPYSLESIGIAIQQELSPEMPSTPDCPKLNCCARLAKRS